MCHRFHVMCHVSHVKWSLSHVMCHVSPVTCHLSLAPTATATDPPLANSSILQLVHKTQDPPKNHNLRMSILTIQRGAEPELE